MRRECFLIVPLHNSVLSFSLGFWPTLPTRSLVYLYRASKQCRLVFLHGATVGRSPRGGVFSNASVPNLVSELNCFFVISSMWMSACLSCGSMDSCFQLTCVAFIRTLIVVPLSCSAFILHQLFFPCNQTFFRVSREAWNTDFRIGIWQILKLLMWSRLFSLNRQSDVTFCCCCFCVPAWHVFPLRDSNICLCHKHGACGCQ